jgi:serine/threonine protein kinase
MISFSQNIPSDEYLELSLKEGEKKMFINPAFINRPAVCLGSGTTGSVFKIKCHVITDQKQKEKEYAVKVFNCFTKGKNEFTCHNEIMARLEKYHEQLSELGITPGVGIEKQILTLVNYSSLNRFDFTVKKLYDHNLSGAIANGFFAEQRNLVAAARQLLEGMLSLMTIGALHYDIKPANILVGRSGKMEVSFTDFEQIEFLHFDERDEEIIKRVSVRIPYLLANEDELNALLEIQRTHPKPAKEFLQKLHKLYSFMLGAAFFEMATKISLRKAIYLTFFIHQLELQKVDSQIIAKLRESYTQIDDKYRGAVIKELEDEHKLLFYMIIGRTLYPDVEILQLPVVQKGLGEYMHNCQVPAFFIALIFNMLDHDQIQRISIPDALQMVKANEAL